MEKLFDTSVSEVFPPKTLSSGNMATRALERVCHEVVISTVRIHVLLLRLLGKICSDRCILFWCFLAVLELMPII